MRKYCGLIVVFKFNKGTFLILTYMVQTQTVYSLTACFFVSIFFLILIFHVFQFIFNVLRTCRLLLFYAAQWPFYIFVVS